MLSRSIPLTSFSKNQQVLSNYPTLADKIAEDKSQTAHTVFKFLQCNTNFFEAVEDNSGKTQTSVGSQVNNSTSSRSTIASSATSTPKTNANTTRTPTYSNSNYSAFNSNQPSTNNDPKPVSIDDFRKVISEEVKTSMEQIFERFKNFSSNNNINAENEELKKKLTAEEEKNGALSLEIANLKQQMTKLKEENAIQLQINADQNQKISNLSLLVEQKENSQRLLDLGVVSNTKTDQIIDMAKRGLSEINDKIINTVLGAGIEDSQGILLEKFMKISFSHAFYCAFDSFESVVDCAFRKLITYMSESLPGFSSKYVLSYPSNTKESQY
ncbi:predicted protein [Naegleria gruberi]|uniref:Predicted protein n=1 Tax=Naegleria gruberi TaxID=5762 RepID=D2VC56_NAEGR|nr:uncharacterized protein NAEGRDRAFT_66454 [Naegleria gruberi]EFC45599.1 predicted protein [Naegleria gruberi]|eukprot:XP_002678343.1 predicted protein [Naegleria gruberi strain NEG-M]